MRLGFLAVVVLMLGGCAKQAETPKQAEAPKKGPRIYVTNERSGDLSVIDGTTLEVVATVPLGKRPRGIHVSPDGKLIYVALSGSPIAGPGVDETPLVSSPLSGSSSSHSGARWASSRASAARFFCPVDR